MNGSTKLRVSMFIAALFSVAAANAQEAPFPSHTVTTLWPYAAIGASVEPIVRHVFSGMQEKTGQPFVLEMRGGANGAIAMGAVAKAKPDGYTMVLSNVSPTSILPFFQKDLPYDSAKDFAPVLLFARTPSFILAGPSLKASNFAETVKLAKEKPGTVSFTVLGAASRLNIARIEAATGAKFLQVPFSSPALMWSQVLGGHVDITVDGGDPKSITKGGALRILATQSATREPSLPDVPAVAELVPGYDSRTWYGFLTTAGTPADRVAFLYREMSAILAQPKSKEILATLGLDPVPGVSPEQFAALIRNELQSNGAAAKQFNIRPE